MEKEIKEFDLSELAIKADLADYSPVRGCMVIKPYGYAIWEAIQAELNKRFKKCGHENAYFPLFIPESFLKKEAEHVEGFAPECAVVTHAGGKKLEEPLIVRPTSETIIYHMFGKWIRSWRDLPMSVNQWANVVRWEMRTRMFLRTTEFLWQEGHTAHVDEEDADKEANKMLLVYEEFMKNVLALEPIIGQKPDSERFAGAKKTYSLEVLLRDGKILQAGTSHYLGDGFAKAFEIEYQTPDNKLKYAHLTSWGVSTRLIGALILGHKDDIGIIFPPKAAPIQVIIIPIFKKDEEKELVLSESEKIQEELEEKLNLRVKIDKRENLSPGFKFNEWELKGVPVRIHIGPRDVQNNVIEIARRDTKEKIKNSPRESMSEFIKGLLEEIQDNLYKSHKKYIGENIREASSIDEMNSILDEHGGFVKIYWEGDDEDEKKLKDLTKATLRVRKFEEFPEFIEKEGKCVLTEKASKNLYFAGRAY